MPGRRLRFARTPVAPGPLAVGAAISGAGTTGRLLVGVLLLALAGLAALSLAQLLRRRRRVEALEREVDELSSALAETDRRLEQASRTDFLTGLPNRRRFLERAEAERLALKRTGRGFTLARLDIDHLKSVNDRWGHECGDQVLAAVASTLRDIVRESDVVARWGSEEFILLLPETDPEGARILSEKVRAQVDSLRVVWGEREVPVTVSIGVTEADLADSIDAVVSRADAALDAAKRAGRDRVEVWRPGLSGEG